MISKFVEQENKMQNAKLTSTFLVKDQADQKRYQKTHTSSAIGRSGKMSPCTVVVEDNRTKEVVFKRAVEQAVAEEKLEGLHEAWASWRFQSTAGVPLENRELARVFEQARRIAQRQLKEAVLSKSEAAICKARQAADAIAELGHGSAAEKEAKMQNAKLTSTFLLKDQTDQKRYQKTHTSSAIGRSGKMSPCPVVVEDNRTKEVVFKRAVEQALAEEKLEGLQTAWGQWQSRSSADVPLDNRELAKLRREAVDIARRQLSDAIVDGRAMVVAEALRSADLVADVFPGSPEVRSSLEYKAARNHGE